MNFKLLAIISILNVLFLCIACKDTNNQQIKSSDKNGLAVLSETEQTQLFDETTTKGLKKELLKAETLVKRGAFDEAEKRYQRLLRKPLNPFQQKYLTQRIEFCRQQVKVSKEHTVQDTTSVKVVQTSQTSQTSQMPDLNWWKSLDIVWQKRLEPQLLNKKEVIEQDIKNLYYNKRVFKANYSKIKDLSPLARLDRLRLVSISGNDIMDLGQLAPLKDLGILFISKTGQRDLSVLENHPKLAQLQATHNEIDNIDALGELSYLQELNVSHNEVTDLTALSQCKKLSRLIISNNPISDCSPLVHLNQLKVLYVAGTKVKDLSQIAQIPNLVELNISNTDVNDLKSLHQCKKLKKLTCKKVAAITDQQIEALKQALPKCTIEK